MNQLYFGDCLAILKELNQQHPKGFIDLVYIDPPFNSKRNYNVLFEQANIKDAVAQKEAFADTWSNVSYKDTISEIQDLDLDLYNFLFALDSIRVSKSAIAYLSTMAIRIYYINKVLKHTGSFYLHCDATMSHYLKLLCDLIFGENNFRSEIIWKRKSGRGESNSQSIGFNRQNDIILMYTKSDDAIFNNALSLENAQDYIEERFKFKDEKGRRYMRSPLNSPSDRPNLKYEYKGYSPPDKGWAVGLELMKKMDAEGRLYFPPDKTQRIYRKIFLDEYQGQPVQNMWSDIPFINPMAKERLGYPTQKPEALLDRIIKASSNEGDLVADFFCGCGTTIASAQKLNRKWLGADISHLAIGLIEKRLIDSYGEKIKKTFEVHGLPKDIASAYRLAQDTTNGRIFFQEWIIETMMQGVCNTKKSADGGFDGYLTFEIPNKKETVLIEVKSGNVTVKNIREFIQVIEKQKASLGVFVCFEQQVTKPMLSEAKSVGYYAKELFGQAYDKIQIITVEDLLEGKRVNIPNSTMGTFKTAQKKNIDDGSKQSKLF